MRGISETIKILREERRLTQQQLADKLEITRSALSMYESGSRIPPDDVKDAICDFFNVDMNYLYGKTNTRNSYRENDDVKFVSKNNIALYTQICCGNGLFIDDYIEDYIAIPDRYIKKGREYFANVASGDSMIGKSINDGDVLVFEKTNVLSNGDIGSFCIGDDYVCKIFRQLNNGLIILESANDKYEPIEIDLADESQCFRIIGKLIATFKKY